MIVKVCGLTRRADVELAVELGAALVGFVVAPGTPRHVTPQRAGELARGLAHAVEPVLVFRGATRAAVQAAARASGIASVQLHSYDEADARALEQAGLRVRRVAAVAPGGALPALEPAPSAERIWHLDVAGGGSGLRFDWSLLAPRAPRHVLVAGGITPDNLAALLALCPFGIDLSSGLESSPGRKDPRKLEALFALLEAVP